MLRADAVQNHASRLALARLHFIQSALDAADGVQRVLVGGGVLHNQFRPAVHGEHHRSAGAFEPLEVRLGVALKIRQRPDVLQGNHNIQFTVLTMLN